MLFYATPTYSLSQYIQIQITCNIVSDSDDEMLRRTPFIISKILSRLELLSKNRSISDDKIMCSFFDLNNSYHFDQIWSNLQENKLQSLKRIVNQNEFKISEATDIRVLSQLLLDFLENFSHTAISSKTIDYLTKTLNSGTAPHQLLQMRFAELNLLPSDRNVKEKSSGVSDYVHKQLTDRK